MLLTKLGIVYNFLTKMKYYRKELLSFLKEHHISFQEYEHEPLYTVEQSKKLRGEIKGGHTKNLFLRDKKKKFYLLSCLEDKDINLKKFRKAINISSLSFASSESLEQILELQPGSVSPFGLINDIKKITTLYLDEDIIKLEKINFHPLVNNYTLSLEPKNFINFLEKIKVKLHLINLKVYKIINNE